MQQRLNPEVNYSTILCDGMSKWRSRHLVEDYRFDIYSGFTRLSLDFRDELLANPNIGLGGRNVVFDYDENRLSVVWTSKDETGRRFAMTHDGNQVSMDEMIGYLNHPLGALVSITQDHMDKARVCSGPAPLPTAPRITLSGVALEAVASHRDVSTFLFTKTGKGMSLDIKLAEESALPVSADGEGARMISFGLSPDELALSWGTGTGRTEERSWPIDILGEMELSRDILPDLIGFAYRTITGDREQDYRGKSANPVWRLIRRLEMSGDGEAR
jgi:hypothetical protein|nr:hypothetical protein [Neorhizobium tomejilense]